MPDTRAGMVIAALVLVAAGCGDDSSARDESEGAGSAIYLAHCASCHADDGSGGTGPAIGDGGANAYSAEELADLVTVGRNGMPPFSDRLSASEIAAVVDFVRDDLEIASTPTEPADTDTDETVVDFEPGLGVPPEVADNAAAWPLPNGDHGATRSVLDSPIDSSTIGELEEVWRYAVPGGSTFGNLATNPLIVGERVFVEGLNGVVHAVDRETGDGLWTAGDSGTMFGPTGVAVGWGRVYATKVGPSGRGQMIAAYDIETGEEVWATDITVDGGEVNVQAFVHDGLVYASTSGFPDGVRGTITALDHESGAIVWSFATVEDPDLWGNPINSGGGAWYPPTVDLDSGTFYWGVGNPYPQPGAPGFPLGTSRPGDNRWTSGTVALDHVTGELEWGFQAFPHDLFDRDHVLATLAEVETGTVLVTAGKGGIVFGHDPATGEVQWSTEVGRHLNDEVTEFEGSLEVLPGAQGGVVTPIANADGVVYVAAVNAAIEHTSPEQDSDGFGTQLFTQPSNVVAIDASEGTIVWDVEVSPDVLGGLTVVNDLVITSTIDGRILALDRATGEQRWSHQADGGINGWPAVAGDMLIVPVGFGEPPHILALQLP